MTHQIHKIDNTTYSLSEDDCWRPGSFTSREAAEAARNVPDEVLIALTKVCDGGQISVDDLRIDPVEV